MRSNRQLLGDRGEALAETWLAERGYVLRARNYRCRTGEIDLIMQQGDLLAFIEVKTRRSEAYGTPAEAVNAFKRRQILQTAEHYLATFDDPVECRFDVVEVWFLDGDAPRVNHLPAAFDADGCGSGHGD